MKIETTRLKLYPLSDVEVCQLIENEEDDTMKQAYK